MSDFLFTSESVAAGHPDKLADQISDAVLDAIIEQDKNARVACETFVKTGVAIVGGEITTSAWVDLEELIRKVIVDTGYDSSEVGYDGHTCGVINIIGKQSSDIRRGVNRERPEDQGAGDQGLMFGYATNETDVLMPAPIYYAHELVKRQCHVRTHSDDGRQHLRPDAKSQVTFRYEDGKPAGIDAIVLSTQHSPESTQDELRELVMEEIIKPVLPSAWLNGNTKYHINPTGRFEIGGPVGDAGLTGRKIIVDTYGGMARHGGVLFPARTPPRWTARRPMRPVTWPRTWWRPAWPTGSRSRCPMPSGLPSRPRSASRPLVPRPSRSRRSSNWCVRNSISGPTASSSGST